MAKKPTMTIDDHYNDELEKMAEMTDEELDTYLAELEEISEEAKNLGIRTVSMDDLEEGDEDIPDYSRTPEEEAFGDEMFGDGFFTEADSAASQQTAEENGEDSSEADSRNHEEAQETSFTVNI